MNTRPIDRELKLRVELVYLSPVIWREVVVRESSFLSELHLVLQIAMGWENRHLYEFRFGDLVIVTPDVDEVIAPRGEMKPESTRLLDLRLKPVDQLAYLYDFGDSWEHMITVLAIEPWDPEARYPKCLDGAEACPPEDCGGFPMYEERRGQIEAPEFDAAKVNKGLLRLSGAH
jgi:hypothetical protein